MFVFFRGNRSGMVNEYKTNKSYQRNEASASLFYYLGFGHFPLSLSLSHTLSSVHTLYALGDLVFYLQLVIFRARQFFYFHAYSLCQPHYAYVYVCVCVCLYLCVCVCLSIWNAPQQRPTNTIKVAIVATTMPSSPSPKECICFSNENVNSIEFTLSDKLSAPSVCKLNVSLFVHGVLLFLSLFLSSSVHRHYPWFIYRI